MDIKCTKEYKTTINPSQICLACDGVYLILPVTNTIIGVWSLQDQCCKPLQLAGHHKDLTAFCLGHQPMPKLLCSTSADYIIIWNLFDAHQSVVKGDQIRGQVIGTNLGIIHYCAFSPDDSLVAVCGGLEVIILEVKTRRPTVTLEGHTGHVTCFEFCPHYSATLISISEDRTFKVWDICQGTLIYQSPILSAFPLISVAMNLKQPQVAMGTSDGQVKIFDLTDGNDFRCLHSIDVFGIIAKKKTEREKIIEDERKPNIRTICSRPSWQNSNYSSKKDDSNISSDSVETGASVLALSYCYRPIKDLENIEISSNNPFSSSEKSVIDDLTHSSPVLLIGTTGAMVQLNANTLDVVSYADFQAPFLSASSDFDPTIIISSAGSLYFGQGANPNDIWCIVGSLFQSTVHVLQWFMANDQNDLSLITRQISAVGLDSVGNQNDPVMNNFLKNIGDQQELTVVSKVPLNGKSPLKSELVPKSKDALTGTGKKKTASHGNSGSGGNHPITFHTKVKSSGYTTPPRTTMFKPQTSFGKSSSEKATKPSFSLEKVLKGQYPMTCNTPSVFQTKVEVAERPTPIKCVQFSDNGKYLACALGNNTGSVFKMPLTDKCTNFLGHNNIVNSVHWSKDGNYLLTSSDDKTAAVWMMGQSDSPLMIFSAYHNNFTVDKGKKDNTKTDHFCKEINSARFYYMDKFILLTSGNELLLYKYHLDTTKQDLKRYASTCKYKLVKAFPVDSQRITALSTVNDFYSYIVLCATSNKSLQIFDMNVGQTVRVIEEVHTRPLHRICQNEGSAFVSHPIPAYDLFATAAAGDAIKLWDLRSNKCVQRFEGHLNKSYPCGLDLSPCGRYLATGAEDKAAYIYELRSGTYCKKLTGHTDVISDVVFNPLYPQLITASVDGKLSLYSDQ